MFVDHSSAGEIGTTRASINRTGKTNASKGVENHYNEYSEFHSREIEAHICASFMEMHGMKTIDGNAIHIKSEWSDPRRNRHDRPIRPSSKFSNHFSHANLKPKNIEINM